ncbi:hypothetical protein AVEN_263384-1, partial [Araneus ventricosus]
CLELKFFPYPLKIRLVILFHKTGKEEQNIKQTKSYRYSGLKEFICKHLPMNLNSSSQTALNTDQRSSQKAQQISPGQV